MKQKLLHVQVKCRPAKRLSEAEKESARIYRGAVIRHKIAILLERLEKLERQRNRQLSHRRAGELIAAQFAKQTTGTTLAAKKQTKEGS